MELYTIKKKCFLSGRLEGLKKHFFIHQPFDFTANLSETTAQSEQRNGSLLVYLYQAGWVDKRFVASFPP